MLNQTYEQKARSDLLATVDKRGGSKENPHAIRKNPRVGKVGY